MRDSLIRFGFMLVLIIVLIGSFFVVPIDTMMMIFQKYGLLINIVVMLYVVFAAVSPKIIGNKKRKEMAKQEYVSLEEGKQEQFDGLYQELYQNHMIQLEKIREKVKIRMIIQYGLLAVFVIIIMLRRKHHYSEFY